MRKLNALWGRNDHAYFPQVLFNPVNGSKNRSGLHDHPSTAPIRSIIGGSMRIICVVSKIVDVKRQQAFILGALHYAL
jgi:hypothetical protein